jgi:sec-independent protein translocase protein TatA
MLAFLSNLGGLDTIVILVVAFLVFGKRLPEIMRGLGSSLSQFKAGMNEAPAPVSIPVAAPIMVAQAQPIAATKQMP